MKVKEVIKALDAEHIVVCDPEKEVLSACGADLMSDVLAFVKHESLLLTGLVNAHVIRTAEMIDVSCIAFVRGKQPPEDICDIARERDIDILATPMTMYEACGALYTKGLPSCPRVEDRL